MPKVNQKLQKRGCNANVHGTEAIVNVIISQGFLGVTISQGNFLQVSLLQLKPKMTWLACSDWIPSGFRNV